MWSELDLIGMGSISERFLFDCLLALSHLFGIWRMQVSKNGTFG